MSKHIGEKCGKWADGDRTDGESDGRTDGDPDGHHHTIIRPVWRRAYKKECLNRGNFSSNIVNQIYDIWRKITSIINITFLQTYRICSYFCPCNAFWASDTCVVTYMTETSLSVTLNNNLKYTWAPQTVHNTSTPVVNILKGYFYLILF